MNKANHLVLFFVFTLMIFLMNHDWLNAQSVSTNSIVKLQSTSLEQRIQAMQEFLSSPIESKTILRSAFENPQYEEVYWKFAYFLSIIGSVQEIPFLLEKQPMVLDEYEQNIWNGSLERLYFKVREVGEQNLQITELSLLLEDSLVQKATASKGKIVFKVFNSSPVPRLVKISLGLWRAKMISFPRTSIRWLAPKKEQTVIHEELEITWKPNTPSIRVSLSLEEVGNPQERLTHKVLYPLTKKQPTEL